MLHFSAIAIFIVGCQSYEPKPLDIGSYRIALETRLDDIEPISAFANRVAMHNDWPSEFDLSDGISPAEGEVIALFYNPELRIARLEAGVALANFETAGLWQDPIFGFNGAEISSPSSPFQYGLMGNFTIPISGRLEVEKTRAGSVYDAQLRSVAHQEWETRNKLRSAWTKWVVATLLLEITHEVTEQLERIERIANLIFESGELNRVEHRLFQVELASHAVQQTEAKLQLLETEMELLTLMGLPPQATTFLLPEFPKLSIPHVEDETERIIDANTELAILFAEYQTAEETLRIEIKKQYPDIVFGSGYGSEFNDHRVLFGLTIPLSIWNRNQAGIANAKSQREVARARAETTFARLYRELALAGSRLELKKEQHLHFEEEVLPMLAEQMRDMNNIAALGEVDMFVLIETMTRQFEANTQLLNLELQKRNAAIAVHTILGPEYQRNPSPLIREISTNDTLGGVQ